MPPPALELAGIFRQYGPAYRQAHKLPLHQHRLMHAIETCRTPALGSVVEWCDHCQYTHIQYRSCRNRHCPKCQDRKSTRLNSSHLGISYAVFCLKKKKKQTNEAPCQGGCEGRPTLTSRATRS